MGVKGNAILGLITLVAFISCGLMAQAQESQVDYDGFVDLSAEIADARAARLVDLDTFNAMKADADTIILDTRSAEAFRMGHIDGAVHLNFSDFTQDKLAKVIPSRDTRILIYCNNNFTDNVAPVPVKRIELALNIPTFINLHGYGYENIYELDGAYSLTDPAIHWISAAAPL
ncbi:MAG: rhodanese-like domain-containing protein [Hyphomonas sp.]|jgi:phage shock protein E|nr:rhodanese-like domain-containing protein [Hyphomonas sp.]